MEKEIDAKAGDEIEISVDFGEKDKVEMVLVLDSTQRDLLDPWYLRRPDRSIPTDRVVMLSQDAPRQSFIIPHDDKWIVVIDAQPDRHPQINHIPHEEK